MRNFSDTQNASPTKSAVSTVRTGAPGKMSLAERLKSVTDEKRGQQKAIPIDLGRYLNELQLLALHSLESFGWTLSFVRRPLFMQPLVVVCNPESTRYAVLEEDGSVNMNTALQLRH